MSKPGIVFLMYHELEIPGRPLSHGEPGYVRYAISALDFREQMRQIQQSGYIGYSVSQALEFPGTPSVGITFDDGCESDVLAAAPVLREFAFGATFYVTYEWLEQKGHLSLRQLKELSQQGFEIGCHSMTHAYLNELDDRGLQSEIVEPKVKLEQAIGKAVHHFSCPGGRYNRRVAEVARKAGYRSVATSRIHPNSPHTDPFCLGRVAVMRGTPLKAVHAIFTGKALARLRTQSQFRNAAKWLFGNSLYDRMRALALGSHDLPRR